MKVQVCGCVLNLTQSLLYCYTSNFSCVAWTLKQGDCDRINLFLTAVSPDVGEKQDSSVIINSLRLFLLLPLLLLSCRYYCCCHGLLTVFSWWNVCLVSQICLASTFVNVVKCVTFTGCHQNLKRHFVTLLMQATSYCIDYVYHMSVEKHQELGHDCCSVYNEPGGGARGTLRLYCVLKRAHHFLFQSFQPPSHLLICGSWQFLHLCWLQSLWHPVGTVDTSQLCVTELWPGRSGCCCGGKCVWGASMPTCSPTVPTAKLKVSWRPLISMPKHTHPSVSVPRCVSLPLYVFIYEEL